MPAFNKTNTEHKLQIVITESTKKKKPAKALLKYKNYADKVAKKEG